MKNTILKDKASVIIDQLRFFRDHPLLIVAIITILVSQLEGQMIEIIWTILPAIYLIFSAIQSLRLIYIIDEINNSISIKSTGHQWCWYFEYSDFKNIEFDSYIIPTDQLKNFY